VSREASALTFDHQRMRMVDRQLKARGITDRRVLGVMSKVPREAFVPHALQMKSYDDQPLPIGFEQTISQPYIVAFMTEQLELGPKHNVLEVGTGSGYQTAVLSQLAHTVYSIEFIPELYAQAKAALSRLQCRNLHLKCGDGAAGWPERGSFDRVMVTAAVTQIPQALADQVRDGGQLIAPVGERKEQTLVLGRKQRDVLITKPLAPVRFVPLQSPN
jgi:protein-L-isoaspartate(D-aspartate) O-methyltransferase